MVLKECMYLKANPLQAFCCLQSRRGREGGKEGGREREGEGEGEREREYLWLSTAGTI